MRKQVKLLCNYPAWEVDCWGIMNLCETSNRLLFVVSCFFFLLISVECNANLCTIVL
jgi:hypothetical protein